MKDDSFRFGPTNNDGPLNYKQINAKTYFNKPVCYENKTECEELQSKMQCSDLRGLRKNDIF